MAPPLQRHLAAMERSQSPDRPRRIPAVTLALITAALYFGRDVLIPLALAILISFILTPSVERLQKLRLGRVPAVLLVVILAFGGIGALTWTMGSQIVDFAETLPRYEQNIRAKAASLHGGGASMLDHAKQTVQHLQEEIGIGSPAPPPVPVPRRGTPRASLSAPLPVTVVEPPDTPLTILRTTLFPLLGPLGTAGLVIIFVIFMLIQREDLRDRLLRLVGQGRLNASTQALDEAAERVSRYLLMQSLINGGTGTAVGLGLFLIGVPNAILWGLFAAVLRFIPYLGPWIAASVPVLISLAVFPGWEKPALTLGLFLLIELISNNVVEPLVYGSETGISTIGILVSAVFWTWLWGPVGLLMATPLTVCLVVIGRYVPQLQFLDVLLGDQPPLPVEAQVYHRLLAMDSSEVGAVLESCMKERTVAQFYDGVLIPALILAERDRHRGELSPERQEFIDTTIRDWIDELAGRTVAGVKLGLRTAVGQATAERLVCVPAHDVADELAGHMFAQLAVRGGTPHVLEAGMARSEVLRRLAELGAEQVFISALAPFAYTQAREVCKGLRSHFPKLRIVVALWDLRAEADRYRRRLTAAGADEVVATLEEAVRAIRLAGAGGRPGGGDGGADEGDPRRRPAAGRDPAGGGRPQAAGREPGGRRAAAGPGGAAGRRHGRADPGRSGEARRRSPARDAPGPGRRRAAGSGVPGARRLRLGRGGGDRPAGPRAADAAGGLERRPSRPKGARRGVRRRHRLRAAARHPLLGDFAAERQPPAGAGGDPASRLPRAALHSRRRRLPRLRQHAPRRRHHPRRRRCPRSPGRDRGQDAAAHLPLRGRRAGARLGGDRPGGSVGRPCTGVCQK
jgi:predicted PurR-regulated permease PerM